jgi:hypothetical protein
MLIHGKNSRVQHVEHMARSGEHLIIIVNLVKTKKLSLSSGNLTELWKIIVFERYIIYINGVMASIAS